MGEKNGDDGMNSMMSSSPIKRKSKEAIATSQGSNSKSLSGTKSGQKRSSSQNNNVSSSKPKSSSKIINSLSNSETVDTNAQNLSSQSSPSSGNSVSSSKPLKKKTSKTVTKSPTTPLPKQPSGVSENLKLDDVHSPYVKVTKSSITNVTSPSTKPVLPKLNDENSSNRLSSKPNSSVKLTEDCSLPTRLSVASVNLSKSKAFRAHVEKAMKDKKVFSVVGVYPAVKNALRKRGWIEKPGPIAFSRSLQANILAPKEETDTSWAARVLQNHPPDFIWVIRRDNIDWKTLAKEQVINRYPKAYFTTKVGLAQCLLNLHWYSESNVADTFFPRCYRICNDDERAAFIEDYRMTACVSLLKYFVETYEKDGGAALFDPSSKITHLVIDFAARQLLNHIRARRHEDIDWNNTPAYMNTHWDAFVNQYYSVVHCKKKFHNENPDVIKSKYDTAKRALQKIFSFLPQFKMDGMENVWICKPGARSRGKGIVIMNHLDKILDLLVRSNIRESNWVVQKYIERPLLIYNTKFDIRQWFIITDWMPLTVWFYKESYVRFCSRPFSLDDFHESIHLCNNAVQIHYQNARNRDSNLPEENMWDCYTFQSYLKSQGKLDMWPGIYTGMKQAIIGVLLTSQETIESRKSCFELYGADFMLTEDYRPWLIEINSCPCMAPSTSITARMCAQCLEDTIKVVIDRKNNKNADTGMFELIYKQSELATLIQPYNTYDLMVQGKKVTKENSFELISNGTKSGTKTLPQSSKGSPPATSSKHATVENGAENKMLSSILSGDEHVTFTELINKLKTKSGLDNTSGMAVRPLNYERNAISNVLGPWGNPKAIVSSKAKGSGMHPTELSSSLRTGEVPALIARKPIVPAINADKIGPNDGKENKSYNKPMGAILRSDGIGNGMDIKSLQPNTLTGERMMIQMPPSAHYTQVYINNHVPPEREVELDHETSTNSPIVDAEPHDKAQVLDCPTLVVQLMMSLNERCVLSNYLEIEETERDIQNKDLGDDHIDEHLTMIDNEQRSDENEVAVTVMEKPDDHVYLSVPETILEVTGESEEVRKYHSKLSVAEETQQLESESADSSKPVAGVDSRPKSINNSDSVTTQTSVAVATDDLKSICVQTSLIFSKQEDNSLPVAEKQAQKNLSDASNNTVSTLPPMSPVCTTSFIRKIYTAEPDDGSPTSAIEGYATIPVKQSAPAAGLPRELETIANANESFLTYTLNEPKQVSIPETSRNLHKTSPKNKSRPSTPKKSIFQSLFGKSKSRAQNSKKEDLSSPRTKSSYSNSSDGSNEGIFHYKNNKLNSLQRVLLDQNYNILESSSSEESSEININNFFTPFVSPPDRKNIRKAASKKPIKYQSAVSKHCDRQVRTGNSAKYLCHKVTARNSKRLTRRKPCPTFPVKKVNIRLH